MLDTIRAFIAVNLEIGTIRRVAALQRSLRASAEAPAGRIAWVAPPNIHLTLRSLGTVDPPLAPALGDALGELVGACPPIRVQLGNVAAFPEPSRARLVIVPAEEPSGALEALTNKIEQLAQSFGLAPEPRPLHPHVTLARLPQPSDVNRWFASLGRTDLAEAQVTECVLYGDEVDRPGAEFTALRRFALAVPAAGRSQRPRAKQASQRPRGRSKPPEAARSTQAEAIPPPPKLPDVPGVGESGSSS